jgi:hypothetical protein
MRAPTCSGMKYVLSRAAPLNFRSMQNGGSAESFMRLAEPPSWLHPFWCDDG